jgi:hypothetical protein
MRIATPVSACIDGTTAVRDQFLILPQAALVGSEKVAVNQSNISRLRLDRPLRLLPVSLGDAMQAISHQGEHGPVVLVGPDNSFGAAIPSNLVKAVAPERDDFHVCTLRCYGHALAFLVQAIHGFVETHQPSVAQLLLFMNKIGDLSHTYILSGRSDTFEPDSNGFQRLLWNILHRFAIYRAELGFPRLEMAAFQQELMGRLGAGTRLWVEAYRSNRTGRSVTATLIKWGIPPSSITQQTLMHASRELPERFVLVSVTPNTGQLQQIGEWAMRWA